MDAAIEVEHVSKRFGTTVALDDVSLEVESGTVLALLGPNGAGKTTLVRVLTTLLQPDSGRASVAGFDVGKDAKTIRTMIGLAGQYATVDELLTGRENLELVGLLYHLEKSEYERRAQEALERMTLVGAGDKPVKTYSGGMRRRLDLAASLIGRPPILFSTNPPRDSIRARGTTCGRSSRSWWPRARPSCSRPSTWKRPSIWRTGSSSWMTVTSWPRAPPTS